MQKSLHSQKVLIAVGVLGLLGLFVIVFQLLPKSVFATVPCTNVEKDCNTTPPECLIEGHKYNHLGRPLKNWTIGVSYGTEPGLVALTKKTDQRGRFCITQAELGDSLGEPYVFETVKNEWTPIRVDVNGVSVSFSTSTNPVGAYVIVVDGEHTVVDFFNQHINNLVKE